MPKESAAAAPAPAPVVEETGEEHELPQESKGAKKILKKVKDAVLEGKSVEDGLKVWEASWQEAIASENAEQAAVDHYKALQYLHRTQADVLAQEQGATGNGDKKSAAEAVLKSIAASQTLMQRAGHGHGSNPPSRSASAEDHSHSPKESSKDHVSIGISPAATSSPKKAKKRPTTAHDDISASPSDKSGKPSSRTSSPAPATSPIAIASSSAASSSSPVAGSPISAATVGSPGSGHGSGKIKHHAPGAPLKISQLTFARDDPVTKIVEFDGKPVKTLKPKSEFENFGQNLHHKPAITFEPQTRTGVANVVKWAVANGKRVRCAGFRHTWSNLYSENDQILLSMIPASKATGKSFNAVTPVIPTPDDLEGITWIGEENGVGYVKIGASTSNGQFLDWSLKNGWTLPMSVDLVEITFGGSTSPMTHGTGIDHPTMSDLVTEVEFINANGELQTVNEQKRLRAAAGALGVMGVITAVTMKLERMSYAVMKPYKPAAMLGVPPPPGWDKPIPKQLDIKATPAQLKGAQKTFEGQIKENYYNEWFWFPFQPKCFVNCWHNDGDASKSKTLTKNQALMQDVQGVFGSWANAVLGCTAGDGEFMTKFVAWSAMNVLPDLGDAKQPEVTPVIEAFYFRRGLHNMPMRDMEMIIPIPARRDKPEKADWTVINRAWWDCIHLIYSYAAQGKYPVRLGLAMHMISDSDMLLAPERGNKVHKGSHRTFGSCSINISTVPQTPQAVWEEFSQDLASVWQSYTHPDGTPLNVRAHWVKEWEFLTTPAGVPLAEHYHKHAYKEQIIEFNKLLKKIASDGGWATKTMRKTFSNPLLDSVLWPEKPIH